MDYLTLEKTTYKIAYQLYNMKSNNLKWRTLNEEKSTTIGSSYKVFLIKQVNLIFQLIGRKI